VLGLWRTHVVAGWRGEKEQTAKTLNAVQGRKKKIGRKVISLGLWHVDFACTCASFIIFLFFPFRELSVSSVDRHVPKTMDGDKADVFSGPY
jgi:hypothetical protein